MKSFIILTLALGLVAGCGAKNDKSSMQTNPGPNSDPGAIFLAANAKKEGVTTTASGLQYKVIKAGMGESPKLADTVKVHYQGTLIDGTIFDSSIQRGQPISFPVGGVIAGWTEALQLMKVGDKWQLFIPARLAYGDQSPTPAIPPNSVLIFEVELLGIEK
jgi:FKBP-type peptidyl-prolyl cis-trans isomerase FklB